MADSHQPTKPAVKHEPVVRPYETQAMQHLRSTLELIGHTTEQINNFRECLISLERQGFTLQGKA